MLPVLLDNLFDYMLGILFLHQKLHSNNKLNFFFYLLQKEHNHLLYYALYLHNQNIYDYIQKYHIILFHFCNHHNYRVCKIQSHKKNNNIHSFLYLLLIICNQKRIEVISTQFVSWDMISWINRKI